MTEADIQYGIGGLAEPADVKSIDLRQQCRLQAAGGKNRSRSGGSHESLILSLVNQPIIFKAAE